MRIAVAYIGQESNTFNRTPSTMANFEAFGVYRGRQMLDKLHSVGPVGGFLHGVDRSAQEVQVVPLIRARAVAGGRITASTLEALTEELVQHLRAAGPLDGLALLLHGACAAAGEDDVEGHLLDAARSAIGDDLPIVVGLDHHANITARMVQSATAIIGHRTQPHDPFETGQLSARLLIDIVAGRIRPTMAWRKLRLLSHQEQYLTSSGPMKQWFDRARHLETSPGVVSVSPFPMQPWLDLAEAGWAVVVVTDGDPALAETRAEEMAELAWSLRDDFQVTTSVPPIEAVRRAAESSGPIILSDTGDSVFGGAGGDSTVLLAELLRARAPRALVPMVDAPAARALTAAGPGARVRVQVGGTVTGWFEPLDLTVTVRAATHLVLSPGDGYQDDRVDMGATAVAEVDSVTLVISERPGVAGNHPALYEHFGLDPSEYGALVLKTASNFQWFRAMTTQVIRANTPGPTQTDITALSWERAPRPIYPVDPVDDWR